MILGESARTGLDEIRGHTLRSSLTLLGIALGTLSITVMLAFMEGVVTAVWQAFAEYRREDLVFLEGREPRTPRERVLFARSHGLQPTDARILEERTHDAAAVAPYVFDWAPIRAGRVETSTSLVGVTPAFEAVYGRPLESGRFLSDLEQGAFARVCVLSYALKQKLFGSEDPLDSTVFVHSRPYRVVGVEERRGNDLVDDLFHREDRDVLYVPLSTLRKFHGGKREEPLEIVVRARGPGRLGALITEIDTILRQVHRGARDFEIVPGDKYTLSYRKSIEDLIRMWIVVLGSVAGVSLLVGGIGLLSMMLIAINERLYEIGLRKALGATERDLFVQFLCEAVILAFAGGSLGVLAGVGFTRAVAGYFKAGLPLNPLALAAAVGVAVLIGALYGIYPALKAARMAPVEALRSAG